VAELAENDIERCIRVGERLGVALDELDRDAGDLRILALQARASGQAPPPWRRGAQP